LPSRGRDNTTRLFALKTGPRRVSPRLGGRACPGPDQDLNRGPAILREKRLEEWRRLWKIRLIESMNPEWIDLFDERTGEILEGPADLSRHR